MRVGAIVGVLYGVTCAFPVDVQAQNATDDEQARQLFEEGRVAHAEGRFLDSLERFERAYRLSPRPRLLYNMARALERLDRRDAAIEHYERFLAAAPDADVRVSVTERIRVLRESSPPPADISKPRIATGIFAAIAGASLVAAPIVWLVANAEYDDCSGGCPEDQVSSVERLVISTNVLFGVSLSAAVLGTIFFFVEGASGAEPALSFAPGSLELRGSF